MQLATDVANQTKSSHHNLENCKGREDFLASHPPDKGTYLVEGFSPLTPPPWAMCQLLGWSRDSSPDFAREADSHPACPLRLISSSRVRFQSQGCSLSSSLYGSQGRTHGTPQRGDEAAPSMLHLPARQNSMHIALPRPAVFKD